MCQHLYLDVNTSKVALHGTEQAGSTLTNQSSQMQVWLLVYLVGLDLIRLV